MRTKSTILFISQKTVQLGGTEIYVKRLSSELDAFGWNVVNAHVSFDSRHEIVVEDEMFSDFKSLLRHVKPNIIHFHNFNPKATPEQIHACKRYGAKAIITFHSPNLCSGHSLIDKQGKPTCGSDLKCAYLRLRNARFSTLTSFLFAWIDLNRKHPLFKVFKFQSMIREHRIGLEDTLKNIDLVHIHAKWMERILLKKGVRKDKIVYIDTGVPFLKKVETKREIHSRIKIAYVGRLVANKGIEILIQAIKKLPRSLDISVHIYGKFFQSSYNNKIANMIRGDSRFEKIESIPCDRVIDKLAEADLTVIPSTEAWIETGPLTVLESFAARTPVIGTNLGGMAERVNDGVDGILFPPGNSKQLSLIIKRLAENADEVLKMKRNIQAPRTMEDVAREMSDCYNILIR